MTYNKTRKMIKAKGLSCDLISMIDFKIVKGRKSYNKRDVIDAIHDEIIYILENR